MVPELSFMTSGDSVWPDDCVTVTWDALKARGSEADARINTSMNVVFKSIPHTYA